MDEGPLASEYITEELEPNRNPYLTHDRERALVTANGFFFSAPFITPILVKNATSDGRDHCANERTYLSWIRISLTLTLVSCAIYSKFRVPRDIKHRPNFRIPDDGIKHGGLFNLLEPFQFSVLLSYIFLLLSLMSLLIGLQTYINTLCGYAFKDTFVQNGRSVRWGVWIIAISILITNLYVLLV